MGGFVVDTYLLHSFIYIRLHNMQKKKRTSGNTHITVAYESDIYIYIYMETVKVETNLVDFTEKSALSSYCDL